MTKVICIKNSMPGRTIGYKYLTIGKVYSGEPRFDVNCYLLTDDNNETCLYHKSNFMLLADWREKQIDSILEDE